MSKSPKNSPKGRGKSRSGNEEPNRPSGEQNGQRDYEVGYGKPPSASRFKAGASGNPKGRPKGAKSLEALFERELNQTVRIRLGDRMVRTRKREVIVKQTVQKAMQGDERSLKILLDLTRRRAGDDPTARQSAQSPELLQIMRDLLKYRQDNTDINSEEDADDDA